MTLSAQVLGEIEKRTDCHDASSATRLKRSHLSNACAVDEKGSSFGCKNAEKLLFFCCLRG